MNLQEFRERYPQYDDLSDERLARSLHEKHYSDMDFSDFSTRFGYRAEDAKPETMSYGELIGGQLAEGAKDVGRSYFSAAEGYGKGLRRSIEEGLIEEGYAPEDTRAYLQDGVSLPARGEITAREPDPMEQALAYPGKAIRSMARGARLGRKLYDLAGKTAEGAQRVSQSPLLQPDKDFQERAAQAEGVKGFAGDVARAAPMMGSSLAAAAIHPMLVPLNIMAQITGMDYEKTLEETGDPVRAFNIAFWDAVMQTPLESIGVGKVASLWKPQKAAISKLKKIGEAGLTETVTEYFQAYPEKLTELWSEQPDAKTLVEVNGFLDEVVTGKFQKGAAYQAGVGGTLGVMGGAAGASISGRIPEEPPPTDLRDIARDELPAPERPPIAGLLPPGSGETVSGPPPDFKLKPKARLEKGAPSAYLTKPELSRMGTPEVFERKGGKVKRRAEKIVDDFVEQQEGEQSLQEDLITRKDGSPFKTEKSAQWAAKARKLKDHEPVEVEGGWALRPKEIKDDTQDIEGVRGEIGERQEPGGPVQDQSAGQEAAEGGGVPQEQEEIEPSEPASTEKATTKEPWEMTQDAFIDYHHTGFIPEEAYDTDNWSIYKKENKPVLYGTKKFNGTKIEFRKTGEKLKYVRTDENDEIVRDNKGLATYLTKKEIIEQGLPLEDETIYAFDGNSAVGYASDEFGATGVFVKKEYQKKGIGRYLLKEYQKNKPPNQKLGQMTNAGERLARSYHKELTQQALSEGKPVPPEVLAEYPDLKPSEAKSAPSLDDQGETQGKVLDEAEKPSEGLPQDPIVKLYAGLPLDEALRQSKELIKQLPGVEKAQDLADVAYFHFKRKAQDRFYPVKRTQEAIKKAGGKITEDTNPYLAEELHSGKIEDKFKKLEKNHIKPLTQAVADSNLSAPRFELFLKARHAPERNDQIAKINEKFREMTPDGKDYVNPGSGMSNKRAKEIIDELKDQGLHDDAVALAKRVDTINDKRNALLVNSGLETQDTIDAWKKAYKHYVPLKGKDEDSIPSAFPRVGKGFDIRGPESRRALGRRSEAKNVLSNTVGQVEETIVRAEKNVVGQRFLNLARENPNPELWEIDKAEKKPYFDERTGEVHYRLDPKYKLADNVLSVKENGQEFHITIHDPYLARAMKNLGADKSGKIVQTLAATNRFLATVNTALSPEFVITNLTRDLQTAGINISGEQSAKLAAKVMKDMPNALQGAYRGLRESKSQNEWVKWFKEFRAEGGKISFFGLRTVEQQQKRLLRSLKDAEGGGLTDARKSVREVGKFVMDVNGAVENAVRLSAYANLRKAGFSKKQAASLAKNLTVNFNRKGEMGIFMNSAYLFYNAGIQGTWRMFQALKSPAVRKIATGIVAGSFLMAEMNRYLGGEDPEDGENYYDKIDDFIKERNMIIMRPNSGGKYFKIPLPYGYNVFHVVGQGINDVYHGKNTMKTSLNVGRAVINAFNPLGGEAGIVQMLSPTVTDWWVQIALNENFYGGKIRPEQPQFGIKKPRSELYWSTVTPTSKAIADKINTMTGGNTVRPGKISISPEDFDHVWSYWTGSAGRFINDATSYIADRIEGKDTPLKRTPFARRFAGEQSEYYAGQKFREHSEKIKILEQERKLFKEEKTEKQYNKFLKDNRDMLKLRFSLKVTERRLRGLYKQRGNIEARKIKESLKEKQIERINKKIELERKSFNKKYNDALNKTGQNQRRLKGRPRE